MYELVPYKNTIPNRIRSWFYNNKNLLGNGFGGVSQMNSNLLNNYGTGWTKSGGVKLLGGNVGKLGTAVGAGLNAVNSIKSIANNNNVRNDSDQMIADIKTLAAGNPMLSSYLTADQMNQLNKIKRGTLNSSSNASMFNSGLLTGALKGGLSGLAMGGIPGAIIGAIGGGVSNGLSDKNAQLQNNNSQLSNLYQSLVDADSQYKRMRVPNYTGLGLQSRYTNQWM